MKSWVTKLGGSEFKVMRIQDAPNGGAVLDQPDRLYEYIVARAPLSLRWNTDTENFGVVHLNTRCRPIGLEIVSNGTLDISLNLRHQYHI